MTEQKQSVVLVKFKGGVEVVGEQVDENESSVFLKKPLQIIMKNIPGIPFPIISLKHYALFTPDDTSIEFKKIDVMVLPARESFVRFYKMQIAGDEFPEELDKQLDQIVHQDTAPVTMSAAEKEDLKQLNYKVRLEMFDVSGVKPS